MSGMSKKYVSIRNTRSKRVDKFQASCVFHKNKTQNNLPIKTSFIWRIIEYL